MRSRELEAVPEGSVPTSSGRETGDNIWRVFSAIDLPEFVHARFKQHIDQLREVTPQPKVSWTRARNVHLTLKFLGSIEKSRVALLSQAADRAVNERTPFTIVIERAGSFPKAGAPRVLWIGVNDHSRGLLELQQKFEDECAKEGFAREQRHFHPHLTLARLRLPPASRALAAAHLQIGFEPIQVVVTELRVIRSQLSSKGSQYTVVSRHLLSS